MSDTKVPKPRVDGQMTGLAGEFFVAAELLKRGLQASLTFGNAKSIDLFAHNEVTQRSFAIQVKALRNRNYFPINAARVQPGCVYVFVILNKLAIAPTFFIVPGKELAESPAKFGKWFLDPKFPGIHPKQLEEYKNNWEVFS